MRIHYVLTAIALLLSAAGAAFPQNQPISPRPHMPVAPPPSTSAMAVSPDGKLIALGYSQRGYVLGGVELISTKTGRGPGVLLNYSQLQVALVASALAFSPDGARLGLGSNNGRVVVWNVTKTGNELLAFDAVPELAKAALDAGGSWTQGRNGEATRNVHAIAFAADGKSLVTITGDGFLKRWHAADGKMLSKLSLGDGQHLRVVTIATDGTVAVSTHANDTLHIWQVDTGTCSRSTSLPKGAIVESLALSPNKGRLAVCYRTGAITIGSDGANSTEGKTLVLDTQTGERIRIIPVVCNDVQFSPSGKMLVSCGQNNPIRIWDIPTGKNVLTLNEWGHNQMIASPDGVHVIGRLYDGVAGWNVLTGERVLGRGK